MVGCNYIFVGIERDIQNIIFATKNICLTCIHKCYVIDVFVIRAVVAIVYTLVKCKCSFISSPWARIEKGDTAIS